MPVEHPDSLKTEDLLYYNSIKNNNVEELYMPFSANVLNPMSLKHEEIFLCEDQTRELTEENKVRKSVFMFDIY